MTESKAKEIKEKKFLVRTEEAFYNARLYRLEVFQSVEKLPDSDFIGYSATLYSKEILGDVWKISEANMDASSDGKDDPAHAA